PAPAGCSHPPTRDERIPLFLLMAGHCLVDVREKRVAPGRPGSFGLLDRMGDLVADLLFEASFPPLVPPSGMLEVPPESSDRIAGPPRRDLRFVAVSSRVIARRVRSEAVRHGLDHGRPMAFAGACGRVAGRPVDREGVHAVYADAVEAVRGG